MITYQDPLLTAFMNSEDTSLPKVTTEQRVRFAILCALKVYKKKKFTQWANRWLSGKDRTRNTAWKISWSLGWKTEVARLTGKEEKRWIVGSATNAASAAWAATRISTSETIHNPDLVKWWVEIWSFRAASWAVKTKKINLIKLAHKAVEDD